MRRLLVLAYNFPPVGVSGVQHAVGLVHRVVRDLHATVVAERNRLSWAVSTGELIAAYERAHQGSFEE